MEKTNFSIARFSLYLYSRKMAACVLLLHLLFFIFTLGPVTARPSAPSSRSPSQRRQNECAVSNTEDEIRAGLREKAMDLGPGSFRITTNAPSGKAFLDARRYTDACAIEVVFQPMESGATRVQETTSDSHCISQTKDNGIEGSSPLATAVIVARLITTTCMCACGTDLPS